LALVFIYKDEIHNFIEQYSQDKSQKSAQNVLKHLHEIKTKANNQFGQVINSVFKSYKELL
jgi:hypothetical protein